MYILRVIFIKGQKFKNIFIIKIIFIIIGLVFFTYLISFIKKIVKSKNEYNNLQNLKDFDLENDYPVKSQRVIVIPQNQWSPTECKFKCEMYSAGGDWEIPVRYFRIQIVSGYCYDDSYVPKEGETYSSGRNSSMNSHFIFIPGKKQGNYHLVPIDKKGERHWSAPDNNQYYKDIDPKANERDCWKAVEDYLKEMVNKEIEHLHQEREEKEGEES
mgnify:CR=1 FL=1